MRGLLVALGVSVAAASPSFAQSFLKTEPYVLAPYAVVFVDNGSCGAGKVLKVRGALGAMRRAKSCVPMGSDQALLTGSIPDVIRR
jgi:hypothetical protein